MAFPQLNILRASIIENSPVQSEFIEHSLEELSHEEKTTFENLIADYGDKGLSPKMLADCYKVVLEDMLAEQIYFKKHKSYRYSKIDEVKKTDFYGADHSRRYLIGLGLTQFLWPNHRDLFQFFRLHLPASSGGEYLEIGPGHGLFFKHALEKSDFRKFSALDMSPAGLELTRDLVGADPRVTYIQSDLLSWETPEKYAAIVMSEVLEHTEDPAAFIRKLKDLSEPSSFIYVSTCINAPATDHLWLFRSADEVREIIGKNGMKIGQEKLIPYFQKTIEESEKKLLPMNIGLVLHHAD